MVGLTLFIFVLVFLLVMCVKVIVHQKSMQKMQGPGYYTPVKVASVSQLSLQDIESIDGVSLLSGDRVLVKDQHTNSDNGIYIASDGQWKRAKDMSKDSQIIVGCTVFVQQGFTHGGSTMVLESVSSDVMGKFGISKAMSFINQLYQTLGRAGEEGDILIADPSSASGVRWDSPSEQQARSNTDEDPIPEKRTVTIAKDTISNELVRLDRMKESSTIRFVLITPGNQMQFQTVKCKHDPTSVSILSKKGNDPKKLIDIRDGSELRVVIANDSENDWELRIGIS